MCCIPMKSNVIRNIWIVFIDLLIRLLPESVARYAIKVDIRYPLKQSWAYIDFLCRAQTCTITNKSSYKWNYESRWKKMVKGTRWHTFSKMRASHNSVHPRKVLLTNFALSSKSMSSNILLLYIGVAWRTPCRNFESS